MSELLRHAAALLLWASGAAALGRRRWRRDGRFVLMFHGVASRRYRQLPRAVQPSMSRDELCRVLAWLARRCTFLRPEELLDGTRPGVLLTFDDGFANNARVALPVLERFGAPAVFFVTSQHVLDPRDWLPATRRQVLRHWPAPEAVPPELARDLFDGMSAGELRACAEHPLLTLGAHSVHHPLLTQLGDVELERELRDGREQLERLGGRPVELFAYPTGDYDARVAAAVRAAGYRAAFAVEPAALAPGAVAPGFEIPRVGLYHRAPWYLAAKLSGFYRPPLRGPARPPESARSCAP